MATIIVQPSGTEIHVEPGDTVLAGLQKAGYAYTVGCRRGGCGICKIDVIEGGFSYCRPVADSVVSEEERTDGTCLSCRAVPDTDVTIKMRDASLRLVNPQLSRLNEKARERARAGKGANIVFDDAGLDNAVYWAVEAIFRNAGQICLAGSRLYVQSGIYDEFMERFTAAAEALTIGDPFDPETTFSALSSKKHFDKVSGYVNGVEADGGTIRTGGVDEHGPWVVWPTIIENLPLTADAYCQEIFGPVCVVNRFETEAEAVHLVNDTRYGLNAMLFTENLSRAHRVSSNLRAGMVWVNCFYVRDLRTPFGGVGDSGVGREGGDFSKEFFTEPKAVVMQIDRTVAGEG